MNDICKYYKNGECYYYKEKFAENEAAKMEFECDDNECPVQHPWKVTENLL